MNIPKLVKLIDPILHRRAAKVIPEEINTRSFQVTLDTLVHAMRHYKGVGIAAPQVGINKQIFVCEVDKNPRYPSAPDIPLQIYLNPEITWYSDEEVLLEEGCLSVRNLRADVLRARKVKLSALDRFGKPVEIAADGFLARIFQHEFDHLRGRLFLERVRDLSSVVRSKLG